VREREQPLYTTTNGRKGLVIPFSTCDRRWLLCALVHVLALSLLLSACAGGAQSGEDLVQKRCTKCHTLAPIEVSQKTQQEWTRTVSRMIQHGARLSDREMHIVVDYLSNSHGSGNY
jgi:hypothetical protein